MKNKAYSNLGGWEAPQGNASLPGEPLVRSSEMVRSQREKDIENLRITIKVLEREDREVELETARFFLREMKNKERQPQTPNQR